MQYEMDIKALYNNNDLYSLKITEDTKNRNHNRIQEIIAYAKGANLNTIGIANCINFSKEAIALKSILEKEGFRVAMVHCKYGRLPFNTLIDGYNGISCNPAGQAKFLKDNGTQLNIVLGLCLGHDMIFNEKSAAPVTTLIVKERKDNVLNILNPKNHG